MAALLPGWSRLKGAARRYQSPAGDIIADRQYRKIVGNAGARTSFDAPRLERQRAAQQQYNRLLSQAAARARQEGGAGSPGATKAELRKSQAFKQTVTDIKQHRKRGRVWSQASEDKKRRALETLGYRAGIPAWVPVGLSDKFRAGKLRRDRIPKAWRPGAVVTKGNVTRPRKAGGKRTSRGH